ncbi:cation ABC transporter substrate-binding protein [Deltaproteobacteria bacterium]|nr:cation ABC transporter substrate-binding protein [Deltaproteobacteria bacterium]
MRARGVKLFFLCLFFPALPLVSQAQAAPIAVTVSIPPQKYFVERIGGEEVSATVISGQGRDPHGYEPNAVQMQGISEAEIYFSIGVPFESQWLPKFCRLNPSMRLVSLPEHVERIKGSPNLALREGAFTRHGGRHEHQGTEGHREQHGLETDDPHLWLSPRVMERTVPVIAAALSAARPDKARFFAERAEAFTAELRELDSYIRSLFVSVPQEKRAFLTFHQSMAYYADNFSLREVSVELAGREPGPKSMTLLMDFAALHDVHVIVADGTTNKSTLSAITRSIKGVAVTGNPLEENWPESLKHFSESLAKALSNSY